MQSVRFNGKLVRLSIFLMLTYAHLGAQPFVDKNTQIKNFNHTHASGSAVGGQGGQLGIQALLNSIKSGGSTGTKVATVNTSLTSGFCLEADADGNIKTAASGAACGAGGNLVTSVFSRTGDVVATSGDYSFSLISGTAAVNQGGTGATTLTGILQGNGTSPFTTNAAATALTYLRRQANTSAVTYNFAPLADLNAGDYDWSQAPGGSLSIGSVTVTLTPGPLGVSGTATGHYVYISGGTGTAEAALITGGTCDGTGQSSCTLGFTVVNNHSGAFTVASASSGIKEAVEILPATGGVVRLSTQFGATRTLHQTLVIGNGTSSTASTKGNVSLIGDGGGATDSEVVPQTAGTMLLWAGPAGGTLVDVEGPFVGIHLRGLFFNCVGSNRAATGLLSTHSISSDFKDLSFNGCSGWTIKHYAYPNPSSVATGANNNNWEKIRIFPELSATSSGIQIGGTTNTGSALDVAQNTYTNFSIFSGSSGTCMELRYTDASTFYNWGCGGSGGMPPATGLKVTESVTLFPQSIMFVNASIVATTVLDDSGWTAANPSAGGWFIPFNNDAEVTDPIGTHGWSAGYSTAGRHWGKFKSTPQLFQTITASTAIASTNSETAFSKVYAIPGYTLQTAGTRIRVTASGKFSTTVTPTLQIALKLGTSGVSGNSFAVIPATTTGSGVSNFGWSIVGEVVMRGALGASTSFTNGSCNGGLEGVTQQSCSYPNTFTLDTTAAQTVTVTAQWGTSSSSNTTTLETLAIEVLPAGVSN